MLGCWSPFNISASSRNRCLSDLFNFFSCLMTNKTRRNQYILQKYSNVVVEIRERKSPSSHTYIFIFIHVCVYFYRLDRCRVGATSQRADFWPRAARSRHIWNGLEAEKQQLNSNRLSLTLSQRLADWSSSRCTNDATGGAEKHWRHFAPMRFLSSECALDKLAERENRLATARRHWRARDQRRTLPTKETIDGNASNAKRVMCFSQHERKNPRRLWRVVMSRCTTLKKWKQTSWNLVGVTLRPIWHIAPYCKDD